MEKFILALDQGTTSSRAIVFDHEGNIRSVAQHEFPQIFPHSGWVEHDPLQIWGSQASVIASAISKIGINGHNIAGIGTTNQRETTIVWDRETGEPVYNAIVWQDRRTSEYFLMQFQSDILQTQVLRPRVTETTALGVAYLAGLAVGFWESIAQIQSQWHVEHEFSPQMSLEKVARDIDGWHDAVERILNDKR